tara:strand:- start:19937 stop:20098 length:162 start_codon:yes stop_codon:yes gene_type:complete
MLPDSKDFKKKQQDLTELNSDGNRTRGRYGEDESHLNREKDEENSDKETKPGG